ncbi:two component transcriptional regulator, LuxR family [Enhydrobacter aerosaccus]|uniref:Two component transcriptional regulator, LuxR family n=1 Tax=Enhydrobacter aerosaccus TaxID=225324 RepID=A0A1T4LWE6_9HYPH|nr:response regulator [Enhydrobacter aerosaccus]SJZ58977.1 two component transcriptional regulator, LuxR family [Enhydrobacter aerosaccus]
MADHVYVVDDDDQFRNSLCALIESVGLQVEGWRDPGSLLNRARIERPGCVVLDYRLPSLSGLEVLRLLRQKSSVPAILISAYADVQTAVAAMEMGAATVFEKPVDDNAFLNKLERFCFEDQQRVLKQARCTLVQSKLARLTDTEREVLAQMRLGHSNKMIARNLSKSVKAVERQRQNVVRKLDCTSAMEAVLTVHMCPIHEQSPLNCPGDGCSGVGR